MEGLLILLGMIIGGVSWHVGLLGMEHLQKQGGCYRHCEYCGKPIDQPLTDVLKRVKRG